MSRQLTLFGKVRRKGKFFPKLDVGDGDLGYTAVIESLWQLSPLEKREEFFKEAQQRWKEVKDDEAARREIIEKAAKLSADQLRPAMVSATTQNNVT